MYQASTVATSWWLGYWSAGAGYAKTCHASEGLSVHAGLSASPPLSVVAYGVASKLGQNAARSLHNQMLDRLLKAPMAFFDRHPRKTGQLILEGFIYHRRGVTRDIGDVALVATSCSATIATVAFATLVLSCCFAL